MKMSTVLQPRYVAVMTLTVEIAYVNSQESAVKTAEKWRNELPESYRNVASGVTLHVLDGLDEESNSTEIRLTTAKSLIE